MTQTKTILGYTEDFTSCDCCGRNDLRGTFAVSTEQGDISYYGCVCVNKMMGIKGGEKGLRREIAAHLNPHIYDFMMATENISRSQFTGINRNSEYNQALFSVLKAQFPQLLVKYKVTIY